LALPILDQFVSSVGIPADPAGRFNFICYVVFITHIILLQTEIQVFKKTFTAFCIFSVALSNQRNRLFDKYRLEIF
jgi:hypothetical protein